MPNVPTTPFPLYLLPSNPFRRRRSSAYSTSTASTGSPSSSPPQPTSFLSRNPTSHLRCYKCLSDLVPVSAIISKGFTGRHGKAYLVAPPSSANVLSGGDTPIDWKKDDLPNTLTHKAVPRQLVTGAHTVSDISCRSCGCVLGWKYVDAVEEAQKYKIGKFILETKRVVKSTGWEDTGIDEDGGLEVKDDDIEFDSQDEDECEDLFSGIWTPKLAKSRRKNRVFSRSG
ncbi:hypothetical protein IAQ61_004723 [Plenodomus lingam]|nr:hypothetical protein IAQ61_004723 [Plenodomus lingam]